jgi:phosphohistidine phosphatase SixA
MLRHWSGRPPELQTCDELLPEVKTGKLARLLRRLVGNAIGLVGHEPDLGRHVASLIGSRKAKVDLAKGGVACIAFPDRPRKREGTLVWLVTPAWIGPTG